MSIDHVNSFPEHKVQKDISLVPWYNATQFKKVYESLYSSDLSKKRWAVDQISVWETRCHPSLPTAVEASLVISRAVIQDVLLTNGATLCQERDIQMMYSMALVRFVNLTIETHQKCHPCVATTAQIAKGLGIPSWIVDLRNEATHSFWPSVASLRLAAESAMKYLNESFWEKEASTLKDFEKEPFNEAKVRQSLKDYIELRGKKMEKPQFNPYEKSDDDLKELESIFMKKKRQFINIFVEDGYFIPFDSVLLNFMPHPECMQYQHTHDGIGAEPKSIPPVPIELECLWKPMLHMFHKVQAIPLFLEALLKSQADRSEMGKRLLISWVIKILRLQLGNCFEETSLKRIFHKRGMVVNWHSMMYSALCRPCLYTPFVFPLIFSRLKLKESVTRYILHLLAIVLGQTDWKSVELTNNYTIKSVEDLKQMKQLQDAKRQNKTRKSDECIWSVAQDPHYMSWPIGFVNNAVDDDEITEELFEDFIPLEDFDEKMDFSEKYFLSNKNDNEEEDSVIDNEPNTSEDEMELSERRTFLYRKK